MSAVTAAHTQPMTIPWINARRADPTRLTVTLERRVTLLVEDDKSPVAELGARVLAVELVALLSLVTAKGRTAEQKRVRAHISDGPQFAATVLEQMEWACHTCPDISVEVSHDAAPIWRTFDQGLATFPFAVRSRVERRPLHGDVELCRRARRLSR